MSSIIVITGASTGFGRLSATTLARQGHRVYATMRGVEGKNREHADSLRNEAEASGWDLRVRELDVADEASVSSAIKAIEAEAGHIDVLVNNAGQAPAGITESFTSEQLAKLMDVNVVGPHRVMRAALPGMRTRKSGLVINITSVVGRIAVPYMGIYNASKWALEALSEAYSDELKGSGVDVVALEPGAFPTEIFGKITNGADESVLAGYPEKLAHMGSYFEAFGAALQGPDSPPPQWIADAIVEQIALPAGQRARRLVVGTMGTTGVRELNEEYERRQQEWLAAMS